VAELLSDTLETAKDRHFITHKSYNSFNAKTQTRCRHKRAILLFNKNFKE
jgi:hypothetical protein